MAAPIVVACVATGLLGEDLGHWAVRLCLLAVLAAAVPLALALLAFAALLGLAGGLAGAPAGGGPLRGGPPTQAALAIALIGPNTGISPSIGLLDATGRRLARAISTSGLSPRNGQVHSIGDLEAALDRGPLLLDGARWFGEGHWFVANRL